MARIFIDGFENGDFLNWDSTDDVVMRSGAGMDGGYYAYLSTSTGCLNKAIPSASEYYFGFWYYPTNDLAGGVFEIRNGSTVLGRILRSQVQQGVLSYYVGSGTTTPSATGTTVIASNTAIYHIGIYIKIDNSAGRAKVVIDGNTDIDFTGDTQPGTDTTMNQFSVGVTAAKQGYANIDNVVVDDSEMPYKTYIQKLVPTADGTTNDWTASTGTRWEAVNEVPYSDTDYISASATGNINTFATGNLTGSIMAIKAVQVQARISYEGSPTPTHIQLGVRSNATDCFADDLSPAGSFITKQRCMPVDPSDLSAWDETKVNAMEIGVKATA